MKTDHEAQWLVLAERFVSALEQFADAQSRAARTVERAHETQAAQTQFLREAAEQILTSVAGLTSLPPTAPKGPAS